MNIANKYREQIEAAKETLNSRLTIASQKLGEAFIIYNKEGEEAIKEFTELQMIANEEFERAMTELGIISSNGKTFTRLPKIDPDLETKKLVIASEFIEEIEEAIKNNVL